MQHVEEDNNDWDDYKNIGEKGSKLHILVIKMYDKMFKGIIGNNFFKSLKLMMDIMKGNFS